MTKKERAEFDAALEKARILGALRWTERVEHDVPPPSWGESTSGWRAFSYGDGSVDQSWSDCVAHGCGERRMRGVGGSKGGISMHSTKLRALKALRHEAEMESAKKLARIDKMIEDEQREPTP